MKENTKETVIKEKSLDELLVETAAKLTQKNYYETEKVPFSEGVVTIHFKSPSHKILMNMNKLPEAEKVPYLLTQTMYNPTENRLYTSEELKALFDGLGGLTETIGGVILRESGFNIPSFVKNPIPQS